MTGRWVVAGVLVGAALAVAGCGQSQHEATGAKMTYDTHCAKCHAQPGETGGPDRGNSKGPKLDKIGAAPGRSKDYLAAYIRAPKSQKPDSKMPGFEGTLTDAQIAELAEWLAEKK